MDDEVRTRRIFDRVLDKTRARDLDWHQGDGCFETPMGSAIVRISSIDDDGRPPFEFEIVTLEEEETIGELRSAGVRLNDSSDDVRARRAQNERLSELFGLVRRQVLGIDSIFEELERELEIRD